MGEGGTGGGINALGMMKNIHCPIRGSILGEPIQRGLDLGSRPRSSKTQVAFVKDLDSGFVLGAFKVLFALGLVQDFPNVRGKSFAQGLDALAPDVHTGQAA